MGPHTEPTSLEYLLISCVFRNPKSLVFNGRSSFSHHTFFLALLTNPNSPRWLRLLFQDNRYFIELLECASFDEISIIWANFFCKQPYFDITNWCNKKISCYVRSCGVNFENSDIFRFLRGPKGGFPQKISNYFFAKN